jgi:hypothetical protein
MREVSRISRTHRQASAEHLSSISRTRYVKELVE